MLENYRSPLENYRSPGSRLGKRPFFELGVMLHGQAALGKCHCFQILRAKRDETIKRMKQQVWDNVHVDGTLSPLGPPDYIPLARARPGPRAVTRTTFAFRPQIHSWGSYVGKYVRTYAKGWGGGEKAADWAQKHTCKSSDAVTKAETQHRKQKPSHKSRKPAGNTDR